MKLDMKSRIAKRMQGIRGEAAFEMLGRANELERQGRSVIHLEIGEPDFDTPEPVVTAGVQWLQKGATHYSPVPGIWDLRTAIAKHLSSRHPQEIDPKTVLVTPGAKMMIFSIIQSIVINHMTRSGEFAGAMEVEHLVDTLLMLDRYYEDTDDDKQPESGLRILRCDKNRNGPEDAEAFFRMTANGLVPHTRLSVVH